MHGSARLTRNEAQDPSRSDCGTTTEDDVDVRRLLPCGERHRRCRGRRSFPLLPSGRARGTSRSSATEGLRRIFGDSIRASSPRKRSTRHQCKGETSIRHRGTPRRSAEAIYRAAHPARESQRFPASDRRRRPRCRCVGVASDGDLPVLPRHRSRTWAPWRVAGLVGRSALVSPVSTRVADMRIALHDDAQMAMTHATVNPIRRR